MINRPSTAQVTKVTEFEPEFGGGTAPADSRRSLSGGAEAQESAAGSAEKTAGDNQPRIRGLEVQLMTQQAAGNLSHRIGGARLGKA